MSFMISQQVAIIRCVNSECIAVNERGSQISVNVILRYVNLCLCVFLCPDSVPGQFVK